eukprot:4858836-Amphidinium_carterae.2
MSFTSASSTTCQIHQAPAYHIASISHRLRRQQNNLHFNFDKLHNDFTESNSYSSSITTHAVRPRLRALIRLSSCQERVRAQIHHFVAVTT